jgi:hypothetical protein
MRDTGDPKTTEGGQIEWGYYETDNPRMCHPRDILEKNEARLSPSQRDLEMEQIIEPLERAMELTPILGELGYNEAIPSTGSSGFGRGRRVLRREPEGARPLVLRRHLGQGRPRLRQADRRLDDRRPHGDRPQFDRLFALLSRIS